MSDGCTPHVLVFAEKNGFVKWLQEVSQAFGVYAVASDGSPSHVSTEYLVAQLRQKVKSLDSLVLFGVTDYDSASAVIARSFREQLEPQGAKVAGLHSVIEPGVFLPQELTDFSFPVPHRYLTEVQR